MIKKIIYVIIGLIFLFVLIKYFVKDTTSAPRITEIKFSDSMSNGLYKSGDKIRIVVSFNDLVVVDPNKDKPVILLETGEIDQHASYISGSKTKNLIFEYIVLPGDTTIMPSQPFESFNSKSIDSYKSFFTSFIKKTINKSSSIFKEIPIVGPAIVQLYRKSIFYPYNLNYYNHRLRLLKQDASIIIATPGTIKGVHNSVNAVLDMPKGIIFNYEFPLRNNYRILVDSSSNIHWKYHMISGNEPRYCNAPCSPKLMIQTKKPEQVFAIDLDGDGDIDVLSASVDSGIAWHENKGDKSFQSKKITDNLKKPRTVHASDLDNDGDIDVVAGSFDLVVWLENDGSENFTMHKITNLDGNTKHVLSNDLDADGDQDILSASQHNHAVIWHENTGSNNFTNHIVANNVYDAHAVYAINMDQDQDVDFLSASFKDHTIAWHENDGFQRFTKHIITDSALFTSSVYAVDLDRDGDIDVLSDAAEIDAIIWYENNGAENFTSHYITTNANRAYDVFPIDLDGDSDIDVLSASSYDNKIAWYENDGLQNFIPHIITTQAMRASSVYAIDIDNDGDIDVISSSQDDHSITWYENHH